MKLPDSRVHLLNGNGKADDLVKRIMKQARRDGIIREDQPPLLQAHWLTDQHVRALAGEVQS